ncbi:hypothetical protein D3C71_2024690 [compost metagenome]
MEDIADNCAGRRGDNADDPRQIGQGALALAREQAFGQQFLATLFEQSHERPGAGRLDLLDDDRIF